MKSVMFILFFLCSVCIYASETNEFELMKVNLEKEVELKGKNKNLIKQINIGMEQFRQLKKDDINFKDKISKIKKIKRMIKKGDTNENRALKEVSKLCRENPKRCQYVLNSTLNGIARKNNLAFHKGGQSLFFENAYASSVDILNCDSGFGSADQGYHLLLVGGTPDCGIRTIGAGLYLAASYHAMLCTHSEKKGINIGVGFKAAGILGVGTSLLVGSNGVCIHVSVGKGGGFFVGGVIIDTTYLVWE